MSAHAFFQNVVVGLGKILRGVVAELEGTWLP